VIYVYIHSLSPFNIVFNTTPASIFKFPYGNFFQHQQILIKHFTK
jgi:hypothetical protein